MMMMITTTKMTTTTMMMMIMMMKKKPRELAGYTKVSLFGRLSVTVYDSSAEGPGFEH